MPLFIGNFYGPGGTDVPVVDGGTGASTDSAARTNLGVTIYDTTTHDAESHENIATVLSPTDHDAVDHTANPFDLLDETAHDVLDHTSLTGIGFIQRKTINTTSTFLINTTYPLDNTLPQGVTEGDLILTLTITPKSTSNKLVFEFTGSGDTNGTSVDPMVFLTRDASANAIHTQRLDNASNGSLGVWLRHEELAPSTSAETYKIYIGVRIGGGFDYELNPAFLAGTQRAIFTITEYAP